MTVCEAFAGRSEELARDRTGRQPRSEQDRTMLIVSGIVGVLLLGYLIYALVKPEKLG